MVPMIKSLRDLASDTNCKDQDGTDLDEVSSHTSSQSILSKHKGFRMKKLGLQRQVAYVTNCAAHGFATVGKISMFLGALLGGRLTLLLSTAWLRRIFILVLLCVAAKMLLSVH
jgi:hypothetical protein